MKQHNILTGLKFVLQDHNFCNDYDGYDCIDTHEFRKQSNEENFNNE